MTKVQGWRQIVGPGFVGAFLIFASPAVAVDFGDDASRWANDGECDDPRFSGPGMTRTLRLDADILHDATDCRQALEADRITLSEPAEAAPLAETPDAPALPGEPTAEVDFGDDTSKWANDGECDDPRFAGAGMTTTALLDSDISHDATDCRKGFEAGEIALKEEGIPAPPADNAAPQPDGFIPDSTVAPLAETTTPELDFGDDSSKWANDGECDDPRFAGAGMTTSALLEEDNGHDAADCRAAFQAGHIAPQ